MRFVIQCVDNAEVEINGSVVGKIGKGYLVLAGIGESDTCDTADRMIEKMLKLRIFEDENGKCLSPSSRCMQTVVKETALPL